MPLAVCILHVHGIHTKALGSAEVSNVQIAVVCPTLKCQQNACNTTDLIHTLLIGRVGTCTSLLQDAANHPQQISPRAHTAHHTCMQIAVAYSILEFQQQPEGSPMSSYIWDVTNPNTPDFELTPQSQLTCINFNLKDTSLVGAGQYNGQFAYFDVRKGSTPVEVSPIEHSHR